MKGKLTLIPTPLNEELNMDSRGLEVLTHALKNPKSIFAIEDLKPGRRRWLRYGLPRERVDDFILYNEHTRDEEKFNLIEKMNNGFDVYLMSDGGLPAFCDPGAELVNLCHNYGIQVTSAPFDNSISLALALSGLSHDRFSFVGFLPVDKNERKETLKSFASTRETIIFMDTPYRLTRVLEELCEVKLNRDICLTLDLGTSEETVFRGASKEALKRFKGQKRPFIGLISPS